MNMLLYLPPEEQANFAEGEWMHFCDNTNFNEVKLHSCEMATPDKRLDDPTSWTSHGLGNIAYMSLNAPEEFRQRWKRVLDRFVEDKLIRGKKDIAMYSVMGNASCNNKLPEDD